jgi:hypothetical protein
VGGGLDELRISCRSGTHLMVQMGHAQLQSEWLMEMPKCVQEDHRVWTTGNRHQDSMASINHLIVLDGLLHLLHKGMHRCSIHGDHEETGMAVQGFEPRTRGL